MRNEKNVKKHIWTVKRVRSLYSKILRIINKEEEGSTMLLGNEGI